jgi:hypothetical protein
MKVPRLLHLTQPRQEQPEHMPIDIDGNDFIVQFTNRIGGGWDAAGVFADPHSAKLHALHLLQSGEAVSVRVVQTRLYGWRDEMGRARLRDNIVDPTSRPALGLPVVVCASWLSGMPERRPLHLTTRA